MYVETLDDMYTNITAISIIAISLIVSGNNNINIELPDIKFNLDII
jgi:hypothetical protein